MGRRTASDLVDAFVAGAGAALAALRVAIAAPVWMLVEIAAEARDRYAAARHWRDLRQITRERRAAERLSMEREQRLFAERARRSR